MNDCSKCCFFRSDAWCYWKLRYVRPDGPVCMQSIGGVTSEEIEELATTVATVARRSSSTITFATDKLSEMVDYCVRQAEIKLREEQKKADDRPKCLSCGKLLYIERRGRDGYCAECGCYIPQIMYDRRFADADKTTNPMSVPRPKPMPTVKCRG